ncbi:MAG: class I tRNA ligase family protein, partial [Coriobacteriia bacterium]|nr:class I tRNA ligase family protein [Coriobacteriia bacterium]
MVSQYDPKSIEAKIFSSWVEGGYFQQKPSAKDAVAGDNPETEGVEPYVITIPPPNVTGSLHMGHALNNTIQDVLIRKNRMAGKAARWVVGTDHAGIATQNKVEQKLAKEGKTRFDIGREAFIDKCWEWRSEHGSQIINQLKAMGCSCDYDREWFTMDPSYQAAVRDVFVDWYNAGLIYRGTRIINWCPRCTTALSDIEVEHADKPGNLYHVNYPVEGAEGVQSITIATTRPETMLGDVAVAVHPDDTRYADLIGKQVRLPLMDRLIPIIADDYVDPTFGTGALKITPAHDANDFEVGQRHKLPQLNIFDKHAVVT